MDKTDREVVVQNDLRKPVIEPGFNSRLLSIKLFAKRLHFDFAADDQRRSLMNSMGLDVESSLFAVNGLSARLFCDHRDRIGFVEKSQFPFRVGDGRRIHEDAAAQ